MDVAVVIGIGIGGATVVALGAWLARGRSVSLDDVPEPDASTCAACGNTDLEHPAEGVYVCRCGFQGGPGLAEHAWKLQTQRIAAMSQADRAAALASAREDARLRLIAARGDYEMAERSFREGEAIVPIGRNAAMRKTELYDEVRGLLPSAEQHLVDAIGAVEKARHIERGGERMHAFYDRLKGSRETALTLTGAQATAALRAQLREVGAVLAELEHELG